MHQYSRKSAIVNKPIEWSCKVPINKKKKKQDKKYKLIIQTQTFKMFDNWKYIELPHNASFIPTSAWGTFGVNIPGVSYTNTGGELLILILFWTNFVIPGFAPTGAHLSTVKIHYLNINEIANINKQKKYHTFF